jgi:hypothetical protein
LTSSRKIQDHLAKEGITVSYKTVLRVLAGKQKTVKGKAAKPKICKNPGTPVVRTLSLIRKMARAVNSLNPPTQRELSRKHGIGLGTVSKILKEDLGMNYKKKVKTHVLTAKQALQRLERGPRFKRCLSRRKLPYIISLDETYVTMNDMTGQRDGYYESKRNPAPESWKKKPRSGWPGKVMVAMGICMRGKTSL